MSQTAKAIMVALVLLLVGAAIGAMAVGFAWALST
jgi:hypothetical protein